MNRFRPLRIALSLALLAALLLTGSASAHAELVRSDPKANAVLDNAPAQITLAFSEAVEPKFSSITVLFEDGSTVDAGDTSVSPTDPQQLSVSLKDSRQGTYIVSWRALSAVDGHITSGAFVFSVGKPINQATASETAQGAGAITSPLDMVGRALTFIGQALIAGAVAFRLLVWRPALKSAQLDETVDDRLMPRTQRLILVALALAGVGAALSLIAQAALNNATIFAWLGTRVGRVWIGRVATLIAIAVLRDDVAAVGRGPRFANIVAVWLSAQLLFLTTLTCHSAAVADPPLIPFAADFIHLVATSVWVGGLALMAFGVPAVAKTLDDEDRAWLWLRTVVNFSTVAAVAVGVLIITGAYLAFLSVGDWPALIGTIYGRTLLLKLALASIAFLIGGYNLVVVKPQLDRAIDHPESGPRLYQRFRRTVTLEAIAGLLVLASVGILTDLPRSKDPQPVAADPAPLQMTTRSGDLDVALTINPARSGSTTYTVRLTQNSQSISDAKDVSLRFTYLTRGIGTSQASATATNDGAYAASGAYVSLPGEWQISVVVRRPSAYDAFADYRVKVNLDGTIEEAGQLGLVDVLIKWLSIYGLLFGGIVAIGFGALWLIIGWRAAPNTALLIVLLIPALIAIPIGLWSVVTFSREATPGLTLTNPFLPDETSLQTGQKVFDANCAVCHGEAGRGNGPAAASLPSKPPDFGNGHLDIHTDGDVFYWIQNGIAQGSPMPLFKGKLTDDEIWNVVNYVRRLRNLAGSAGPQPAPALTPTVASPVVLQPYTPPSFIAPEVPTTITPTPSSSGDPAALKLLAQSDAAMNALTSLIEDQTLRGDGSDQLQVRFEFNAPDRLGYQIAGGAASLQIGMDDYQQKPDGTWFKNQRAVPLKWPQFTYAQVATNAKLDGEESIGGALAKIVAFRLNEFDFRMWIDPVTGHILKYAMDGAGHHMQSTYSAFNSAPVIEAPLK